MEQKLYRRDYGGDYEPQRCTNGDFPNELNF